MDGVEHKLAWTKTDPFTAQVRDAITNGGHVAFDDILAACGGAVKLFPDGSPNNYDKGTFSIFQTSVFMRNEKGEVAVFHRHKYSHRRHRITEGKSILISGSSAKPPWKSVAPLIRSKCSFGKKDQLTGIGQMGVALNDLPNRDGMPQPTYCMNVHEFQLRNNRFNGLNRLFPDSFVEWKLPAKLNDGKLDGYVDRAIVQSLACGSEELIEQHDGYMLYHPGARVVNASGTVPPVERDEVSDARCAFISHAGDDWLLADLFAQFMVQLSGGSVYPVVDLHDLKQGKKMWRQIHRLIRNSDCVVVLITPSTAGSEGVEKEFEYAKKKGVPVLGLMVSADPPSYISKDVCYDLTKYRKTLGELESVINMIREQPYRGNA